MVMPMTYMLCVMVHLLDHYIYTFGIICNFLEIKKAALNEAAPKILIFLLFLEC